MAGRPRVGGAPTEPRLFAVLAVLAVGGPASTAEASGGAWSSAGLSIDASDNAFGVADDAEEPRVAAVGMRFTSGLRLWYELPRALLLTQYAHTTQINLGLSETGLGTRRADLSADTLDSTALLPLSPRDDLQLGVTLRRATARQSFLGSAEEGTAAALTSAPEPLLTVGVHGASRHALSPDWTYAQSLALRVTTPLAEVPTLPPNFGASLAVGPQLALGDHGFALLSIAEYLHRRPVTADEGDVGLHQLGLGSALRWRWDLALAWSTEASLGLAVPFVEEIGAPGFLAGALVRYAEDGISASLGYSRRLDNNPLGNLLYFDELRLAGVVPITRDGQVTARGSTALGFSRLVATAEDTAGDTADQSFKTWIADLAVDWSPTRWPLGVALRYQHQRQFDAPEEAVTGNQHSNVVTLSARVFYPPGLQPGAVPRPSVRVDGSDAPTYQPPSAPPD